MNFNSVSKVPSTPRASLFKSTGSCAVSDLPEQGAYTVQYFDDTMIGSNYPVRSRPRLFQVGRRPTEEPEERGTVCAYGR